MLLQNAGGSELRDHLWIQLTCSLSIVRTETLLTAPVQ